MAAVPPQPIPEQVCATGTRLLDTGQQGDDKPDSRGDTSGCVELPLWRPGAISFGTNVCKAEAAHDEHNAHP